MELVSSLSECLTTTLKQAIPKLIEQYSWTAKAEEMTKLGEGIGEDIAKEGMNLFDKFSNHGGASGGTAGDGTRQIDETAKIKGTPQNPNPPVVDEDLNDPALLQADIAFSYANTMKALVQGKNGEPDWNLLTAKVQSNKQPGLDVILDLVKDAQAAFQPSARGKPSKTLTEIYATCLEVCIDSDHAI